MNLYHFAENAVYMAKGMLSVFAVIGTVILAVYLLNWLTNKRKT